jgi:general L-amino acid transport system ATP-binding protein
MRRDLAGTARPRAGTARPAASAATASDIGPRDAQAVVRMIGVSKSFGAAPVLRDINLTVAHGERIVVCGPSGSGKSTLIRCISGLEPFQSGLIVVAGRELSPGRKRAKARSNVGMVFQSFNLFPHLSVLKNCTLGPMWVKKMRREAAEELAMRHLQQVRIADQAHKYPAELSGGQQQRAAIARSLCMQPEIILFDEPTSSLDPEMVKEVLDTMIALARDGMTMIVVTHEMGFAKQVADHVVFLDQGRVVETNTPEAFFTTPQHERARTFINQVLR